jgi:hypothetical protein
MSLVFAKECTQALLDFLFFTDVGRISGVVEEAENSEDVKSSPEGGVKVDVLAVFFCWGGWGLQLCFCSYVQEKRGGNFGYMLQLQAAECNMITNKQTQTLRPRTRTSIPFCRGESPYLRSVSERHIHWYDVPPADGII